MSRHSRSTRAGLAAATGAAAVLAVLIVVASAAARPLTPSGHATPLARTAATAHPCLVMAGSGDPAFTKNFNPFTATGLPSGQFVRGAVYEGLTVSPEGGKPTLPWLARSWKWSNGNKTLTLQLAKGVKWSDGKALTSTDVVYSLTAGKQNKVMDIVGLTRPDTNIASVKAKGSYAVVINLKTPDSQFIAATLNAPVRDPAAHLVEGRRPGDVHEPEPGRLGPVHAHHALHDAGLRPEQEPELLAGRQAADQLPRVRAGGVERRGARARSRAARSTGRTTSSRTSTRRTSRRTRRTSTRSTRRRRIRSRSSSTTPSTRTASSPSGTRSRWRSTATRCRSSASTATRRRPTRSGSTGSSRSGSPTPKVKARAKPLSTYNPTAAKKLLTDNGFTYKGNKLYDPKGNAVSLDIHVISGWSDWVASNQIITKNLQGIGIDSNVKLEPDWGSWFPNAYATKNPTLLWQNGSQASPYGFFNANLSQNSLIPSGQDASATGNWSHTYDAQATGLLNQWKVTLDAKKQQAIATQLETIFLDNMPIVPLFIGPRWSTYSTKYFHCFNSPKNFYGDPIFTTYPDNLLSFTRICPGGKAGA